MKTPDPYCVTQLNLSCLKQPRRISVVTFFLSVVKAWHKPLFKPVLCCIYPIMDVDNTHMQITQGLGMYSVK